MITFYTLIALLCQTNHGPPPAAHAINAPIYPIIHTKKSGPLGVLINEEVLWGMILEEPALLIDTIRIFMGLV